MRSILHTWTVMSSLLRVREQNSATSALVAFGCQPWMLFLCNFLTWKKESGLSFNYTLSVAEVLWHEVLTSIFQPPFTGKWANRHPSWPLFRFLCEWFLFSLQVLLFSFLFMFSILKCVTALQHRPQPCSPAQHCGTHL